jgi:hypothetical protein
MYACATDFCVNDGSARLVTMVSQRRFYRLRRCSVEIQRAKAKILPSRICSESRLAPADSCQLFTLALVAKMELSRFCHEGVASRRVSAYNPVIAAERDAERRRTLRQATERKE